MNSKIFSFTVALISIFNTIVHAENLTNFSATCSNGYFPIQLVTLPSSNQVKALVTPKDASLDYSRADPIRVFTSTTLNVSSDYISFIGVSLDDRKYKFELERKTGTLRYSSMSSMSSSTIMMNCEKDADYSSALNKIINYENQIKVAISQVKEKRLEEERARNNRPNKF